MAKTPTMLKYDAYKQQLEAFKATQGKKLVADIMQIVFNESPDMYAISWQQYTPYFNDGEPCEFSVNLADGSVATTAHAAEVDEEIAEEELNPYPWRDHKKDDPTWIETYQFFGDNTASIHALGSLGDEYEDLFRDVYGDHVTIVMLRNGTSYVLDYDHD